MSAKPGRPPDDVSSAPESGTVRDETSGNQSSDRGLDPAQAARHAHPDDGRRNDDPGVASEER